VVDDAHEGAGDAAGDEDENDAEEQESLRSTRAGGSSGLLRLLLVHDVCLLSAVAAGGEAPLP
jgi:hypothetical protein